VRGWLFAKGAFDKGDLLYLRNEEERRKFVEQEQEFNERQAVRRVGAAPEDVLAVMLGRSAATLQSVA
jgi:hypothetical protein